jgi:hypothetical protein
MFVFNAARYGLSFLSSFHLDVESISEVRGHSVTLNDRVIIQKMVSRGNLQINMEFEP